MKKKSFGTKTAIALAIAAFAAGAAVAADPIKTTDDFENKFVIEAGDAYELTGAGVNGEDNRWGATAETGIADWNINGSLTLNGYYLVWQGTGSDPRNTPLASSNLKINNGAVVTLKGTETHSSRLSASHIAVTGGSIALEGDSAFGSYMSFNMTGGDVTIGKDAKVWYSSDLADTDTDKATGEMTLAGGTINLAGGKLAAGDENDADEINLAGTTLNVKKIAEDGGQNILQAQMITQDGSRVVLEEGSSLTIQSIHATNKATASYTLKSGDFTIGKDATASFGMDVDVAGGTITNNGGKFESTGALTIRDGGKFTSALNGKTFAAATINLQNGGVLNLTELNSKLEGGALLVSGAGKTPLTVNLDGGEVRLNDSAYTGQYKIGEKTDVGIVNITSGEYHASKIWFGAAEGNQLKVEAHSDLHVGLLDATNGQTVINGDLYADKVQIGVAATEETPATQGVGEHFDIGEHGYADIGEFVINAGQTYTHDNGEMDIGTLTVAEGGAFKMIKGEVYTESENLVKEDLSGTKDGISVTGGEVYLTDSGDGYTIEDWRKMNHAVFGDSINGQVAYLNQNIVTADGTNVSLVDVVQEGIKDVGYSTLTFEFGPNRDWAGKNASELMFGALDLSEAEGYDKTYKVGSENGSLTLRGDRNGVVFSGLEDKTLTLANVDFGDGEEDSGTINHKLVLEGKSTVTGTFTMTNGLTIDNEAGTSAMLTVAEDGTLVVKNGLSFTTAGSNTEVVTVKGNLGVDWMEDKAGVVSIDGGVFAIEGNKPLAEGEEAPTGAFSGAVDVGMVKFGDSGVYGIGADLAATQTAVAKYFDAEELGGKKVVFLAKQTDNNGAAFDASGMDAILDMQGIANTAGFTAKDGAVNADITVNDGTTLHLMNLTSAALEGKAGEKTFRVATTSTGTGAKVDFGTIFYGNGNYTTVPTDDETGHIEAINNFGTIENGLVSFKPDQNVINFVDGRTFSANLINDVNEVNFDNFTSKIVFGLDDLAIAAYNEAIDRGLTDANEIRDYVDNKVSAALDGAELAQNMAVAGGAFSTAVDINNEVWKALDRRMSAANLNAPRNAYGVTPWVDVIGTTNEAKDIFGGAGYEADIYGAVLGADWTAPCGAIVGLAFSVGQADANSVDLDTKVDNDVDFWGVSLYGSHRVGNFNGKVDFGYVSTSNDLSAHTAFGKLDESLDADIFTIGLGGEYIVNAGSFDVVPHAGIRWSSIDMDSSKYGADYDKMNLFQMPIGVTFSGTIEMTGWKVAPMVDLSVVPAFGDKDAVASFEGGINDTTRVVDTNPIQMTLGVNAQVDAWTFGVNYSLMAGGEERLNNSFNLNARYTF